MENSAAVPQESKEKITVSAHNSISRYIHKRTERRLSPKYWHTHVHDSQKVEITPKSKCPLSDGQQNKCGIAHMVSVKYKTAKFENPLRRKNMKNIQLKQFSVFFKMSGN